MVCWGCANAVPSGQVIQNQQHVPRHLQAGVTNVCGRPGIAGHGSVNPAHARVRGQTAARGRIRRSLPSVHRQRPAKGRGGVSGKPFSVRCPPFGNRVHGYTGVRRWVGGGRGGVVTQLLPPSSGKGSAGAGAMWCWAGGGGVRNMRWHVAGAVPWSSRSPMVTNERGRCVGARRVQRCAAQRGGNRSVKVG